MEPQAMIVVAAWTSFADSVDNNNSNRIGGSTAGFDGVQDLCSGGLATLTANFFLEKLLALLKKVHIKQFWKQYVSGLGEDVAEAEKLLSSSLQALCTVVQHHMQLIRQLQQQMWACLGSAAQASSTAVLVGLQQQYMRTAGAMLSNAAPCSMTDLLSQYFGAKLTEFSQANNAPGKSDSSDEGEDESDAMDVSRSPRPAVTVMGEAWVQRLLQILMYVQQLGLEGSSEEAYTAVVCQQVQEHLASHTKRVFDSPLLPAAQAYVAAVPLQFLRLLLSQEQGQCSLQQWQSRLDYYVYETVGQLRTTEMFDIVVDYPDSQPAVQDVKDCLAHTNLHRKFVAGFKQAIGERLLHAGAATSDIIEQYVSTIKTLREVDPTAVLLEAVAEDIREYLRSRRDTIRHKPSEAEGESLFEELKRTVADEGEDSDDEAETDEAALASAGRWEPDPVDADPSRSARSRRMHDIISMLVGIYGSKELFITEYRAMLSDKLLSKTDYNCDREIRTLELLKLRFGDANLHNCEVMLKDIADSKRMNSNIKALPTVVTSPVRGRRQDAVSISPLTSTVTSALFWPPHHQDTLKLPSQIQAMLDTYASKYHDLKAPRKLKWKPALGSVSLTIRVGGDNLDLNVTPLHATIIMHFQEQSSWKASELAKLVELAVPKLRMGAIFWINQGVLTESRGTAGDAVYTRVERLVEGGANRAAREAATSLAPENDPPMASVQDMVRQDMAVYETYIMGMLTNFDAGMPLDRIHNMLKMFVVDPPYDKSADQLAAFLGRLVADEKLVMQGDLFRKRSSAQ
ncbi:MAG: anaphase-promoting complex subunit 2-like [Trebouxia sp. A1-2]|nr:MAG: anaphase-promoting complex subunit 2-like [Trebouxia sp. A1-2]